MFAMTFESIGHIVHLVQDVATPAHSRNDTHAPPNSDRFHSWAARQRDLILEMTPFLFNDDLLATATGDSSAPRPVARIIDATEADRNQAAWSSDIGLAEYSNSQFLSDDSRWSAYPRPSRSAMEVVEDSYTVDGLFGPLTVTRKYYQFSASSGEGETDYYVAAQRPLDRAKPGSRKPILDRRVLDDYVRKLLPRAIGYSVSAIDHFFRGRIDVAPPARFVYGRTTYAEGNVSSFETLRFKVANDSPAGHETGGVGDLYAVVHYRESDANLFEDPGASLSEPRYAVSGPLEVGLTRAPQEVRFDFAEGELPANAADVWLLVVYRGELGGESDAVLVGSIDLPEPQPIDFANLTDYDCDAGEFHYVANLAPNDPARDRPSGYHLIGPALEESQYRKVSDGSLSIPWFPSSTFFDFHVPESRIVGSPAIADGVTPTSRFVVLQDASTIWRVERSNLRDEHGTLVENQRIFGFKTFARRNDFIRTSDGLVRSFPSLIRYRGWTGYHLIFTASDAFLACHSPQNSNQDALPDLTRIPGALAPEEP